MSITHPTWYLFRHALATYDKKGYGDQILTAAILKHEVAPIEKMATYLQKVKDSINVSSTLLRCKQTIDIISRGSGKIFITDKRLNEYYSESFEEFHQRVTQWVHDIGKIQPSAVLVCSHGAVIAGIKHTLLYGDFRENDIRDYPDCGQLLIIKHKSTKLVNFNE